MTLGDFKQIVLRLIEEIDVNKKDLTDDPDIANKFNTVTNQLMYELFRYKGIVVKDTINVKENEEYILSEEYSDFYQFYLLLFRLLLSNKISPFPSEYLRSIQ